MQNININQQICQALLLQLSRKHLHLTEGMNWEAIFEIYFVPSLPFNLGTKSLYFPFFLFCYFYLFALPIYNFLQLFSFYHFEYSSFPPFSISLFMSPPCHFSQNSRFIKVLWTIDKESISILKVLCWNSLISNVPNVQ